MIFFVRAVDRIGYTQWEHGMDQVYARVQKRVDNARQKLCGEGPTQVQPRPLVWVVAPNVWHGGRGIDACLVFSYCSFLPPGVSVHSADLEGMVFKNQRTRDRTKMLAATNNASCAAISCVCLRPASWQLTGRSLQGKR